MNQKECRYIVYPKKKAMRLLVAEIKKRMGIIGAQHDKPMLTIKGLAKDAKISQGLLYYVIKFQKPLAWSAFEKLAEKVEMDLTKLKIKKQDHLSIWDRKRARCNDMK